MVKKYLSLWLVMLMLLPGGALADETQAMGRYVEHEIQMPEEPILIYQLLLSEEDGRLMMLGRTETGISAYAEDTQGWVRTPIAPEDAEFYDIVQHGEDLYVLYYQGSNGDITVKAARYVDGQMLPLDMDLNGAYPSAIAAMADGTLLIQSHDDRILAFDPSTGALREQFDGLGGAFTTQGKEFFAVSRTGQSVMQFDVATGQLINEMKNAPITGQDALAFDGESLYLANRGGIYRIAPGGSVWEQLVDGNLTSLCLPSLSVGGMVVRSGDLYVLVQGEQGSRLMRYTYDANISARPLYELNVCTLYENDALTQAAALFQKQNPDYMVNVTTLLSGDAGVTADDVIRALNTEILAGKGPDVLLLDGMPMSDYIDKGVLYDLSQMVNDLAGAGELVTSLFEPLYQDGKIYAVPTACSLPVVLGKDENLNHIETLDDMVSLIGQSQVETPIVWRTRQGYFSMFLPASFPAWFGTDGQLDEETFAHYLEAIDAVFARTGVKDGEEDDETLTNEKTYLNTISQLEDGDDLMNGSGGWIFDLPRLSDGRSLLHPTTLGSFNTLMMEMTALNDMGGTLTWLPGQARRVYAPSGMLGVNARGGQIDAAVELVRTALSQDVQDVDIYGGLPVNQKSLSKHIEKDSSDSSVSSVIMDSETGVQVAMEGYWPVRELREKIGAMLSEAATPYIPDNTLINMIKSELAPYFEGEMDAQAAAALVSAKVRAYLAE